MEKPAPDYRTQFEAHSEFRDLADATVTLPDVNGTLHSFLLHSQILGKLSNHISSYISTKKAETTSNEPFDLTELFKDEDVNTVHWFFYYAYCQEGYQALLEAAVSNAFRITLFDGSIFEPFWALVKFLQFCDKFDAPSRLWKCVEAKVANCVSDDTGSLAQRTVDRPARDNVSKRRSCFVYSNAFIREWTVLSRQLEHRMPCLMDLIYKDVKHIRCTGPYEIILKDDRPPPEFLYNHQGDPGWEQAQLDWEEEFQRQELEQEMLAYEQHY